MNQKLYAPSIILYEELPDKTFYEELCEKYNCQFVILKNRINTDCLRTPKTRLLYSTTEITNDDQVFAKVKQNGCWYKWYPLKSMFCRGNIYEKIRMRNNLTLEVSEVILDLYAGIGYWTIPLLKNNQNIQVIACDMNPWSIKALRENLKSNKVEERCIVLEGDNAEFLDKYRNSCDRVLLGLLPSSKNGCPLAIQALKPNGGILHLHENVAKAELDQFQLQKIEELKSLWSKYKQSNCTIFRIEKVNCIKSYSPRVFHYVFDILIKL